MSELESGSATVGGGRGDAIILTLYVRVGLGLSRRVSDVLLEWPLVRRKLSLNSKIKKLVLFLKFISVLTAPFYTSFPTLSPPPPTPPDPCEVK